MLQNSLAVTQSFAAILEREALEKLHDNRGWLYLQIAIVRDRVFIDTNINANFVDKGDGQPPNFFPFVRSASPRNLKKLIYELILRVYYGLRSEHPQITIYLKALLIKQVERFICLLGGASLPD